MARLSSSRLFSPTHRVEVLDSGVAEAAGDFPRGDDGRDRISIAHRLPHGDNVRDDVLAVDLEGPHMSANPPETDLDLVGDADASGFARVSARRSISHACVFTDIRSDPERSPERVPEVIMRRNDLAADRYEALRDERANSATRGLDVLADLLHVLGVLDAEVVVPVVGGAIFAPVDVRTWSLSRRR